MPDTETDPRIRAAEALEAAADAAEQALCDIAIGGNGTDRWTAERTDVGVGNDLVAQTVRGVDSLNEYAVGAYIALVDPTVGRALAALLRQHASHHVPGAYAEQPDGRAYRLCACGERPCPEGPVVTAVARAVLREGGDVDA